MEISDLCIGDILLIKGHKKISKLISKYTDSSYSHVCCYVGNKKIIEASIGGVQVNHINKYVNYTIIRYNNPNRSTYKLNKAVKWMKSQQGKGYDYLGLVGILFSTILKKDRNILDGKNRYWCSELIADGYIQANMDLDVCKSTYKVSPADLYNNKNFKLIAEDITF